MDFERYRLNCESFSRAEVEQLFNKRVAVIGCGGLGGYVIQMLARLGVGKLSICDGDVFSMSNLNRQVFCDMSAIGKSKALHTKDCVWRINPNTEVTAFAEMLTEENGERILEGADLVVDCLDSIPARRLLVKLCERLGLTLVSGAIGGFYGQVTVVFPGDKTLDYIYPEGIENHDAGLGNPPFTPALIAAVQVAQAAKFLTRKGELLRHKLFFIDTLNDRSEVIEFEGMNG